MRCALGGGAELGIAWVAWALAACSKPAVSPGAAPSPTGSPAPVPVATPLLPPPFDALPSLDALRARASLVAPGMREIARGEISNLSPAPAATLLLVRADDSDTCVRVVLVAQPALHAWLTGSRDDILADVSSATDTAIAPRGPVCVRKGDSVTLHVTGEGSWAGRYAVWASSFSPPASSK